VLPTHFAPALVVDGPAALPICVVKSVGNGMASFTPTGRLDRRMEETMSRATRYGAAVLLLAVPPLAGCTADASVAERSESIPVTGSAVYYGSSAILHSEEATGNGTIQRGTAVVRLSGDVSGWVLYHVTSTFDAGSATLENTGISSFSGTIAGSDPVFLAGDRSRFTADLSTKKMTGEVLLSRSSDAPGDSGWFDCRLVVVGTGRTAEGDELSDYSGECTPRGGSVGP
jgi:hypothetical protein